MSAEQVALTPQCAECLDVWLPDDEEQWRAYLDTDDQQGVSVDRSSYIASSPNPTK